MAAIAEQFAHIEQAASALVEELEGLKSETQHYSAAAASLEIAGQRLGNLALEATDLSTRAAEVVAALKEIGTPQLLSGLEALTARYSEHAARLEALDHMIRGAADKTAAAGENIQALAKDLRQGYSETASSLKQVLTRLDHVGATSIATEQKSSQAISKMESLGSAISAVDTRVDAARTALNQLLAQSDKINGSVSTVASRLESHSATSDQRLRDLGGEANRIFKVAGVTVLLAGASLVTSLVTLAYVLVAHR